jgi:iron complex transport system permease protein
MEFEHTSASKVWRYSVLALLIVAAALLGLPLIGSTNINLFKAFAGVWPDREILFGVRLPRVMLSMLAGGALSLAGVLLQALLRDALATTDTLGISSGASLGAVVAICIGVPQVLGVGGVWLAASAGGSVALLLVMGVARGSGRLSSFTLLMSGVTINSIATALILFVHSLASFGQSFTIMRWLMGGVEPAQYSTLLVLTIVIFGAALMIFRHARTWNLLAVGEEWAAIRGVSTIAMIRSGFVISSLLTGVVTALTGPIGFVGLIVPHAVRIITGPDHRLLIPCAFLGGAVFLAICDTLARTIIAPAELPVGVITAIVGGPVFIWILRSRGRTR